MRLPMRLLVIVAAAAVFFLMPTAVEFLSDWLWFGELGFRDVYRTRLTAEAVLFAVAFVVSWAWLAFHVRTALRSISAAPITFTTREGFAIALPTRDQIRPVATFAVVIASVLVASICSSEWLPLLTWWNHVPFGKADPVLQYDASFYVYAVPVVELVRAFGLGLIVLAALGASALYVAAGQMALTPFGLNVGREARRHLTWLASGLFVIMAIGAWLGRINEITASSGLIHGASYADVYARMPAALALMVAALIGAGLCAAAAVTARTRYLIGAAAIYFVTLFGGQVYASLLQRFAVTPNEQVRETPFMEYNIAATRAAFGIDTVEERELNGDATLTRADIQNNRATLDNVRLWDHQPLLETFGQIQEIRTYYDFVSVDNDRYMIDGQSRQVMLSARELNPGALPNRTWVNERLVFTHGHGLTLGPVNQVTSEGLPVLFIKDLPPISTIDVKVDEPSIYFGELNNEYAIVRTKAQEFHYPKGEDNVYSQYAGTGGVPIGTLWRKLLFAARFRDYQILLSDDITSESRVMFDRQIRARVEKIAPFLIYDDDPYPVVTDGRIVWIQDAYTATDRYPYSTEAAPGINYIRNSVKVVIDAYQGSVTFYFADPGDPIAQTLARVFPSLLRPLTDMPEGLRRHVRYPEGIFQLQSQVYATYHMTNPAVFYNKEDQWEAPSVDAGGGANERMRPYYTMMKLPGETNAEFIQMLPFTPRKRDNLASWMVARSDGAEYGKLLVFRFPKQTLVFGPQQVVARINQDQTISPQLTLWNQRGSEVIQGTLMVIPIEESLIYVRPLYLRAQAGRIPELTRVIVAYQNRIVMERTLDQAIARLFGDTDNQSKTATPSTTTANPPAPSAAGTPSEEWMKMASEARDTYQRALEAQKAGDWAKYGEEQKAIGDALAKIEAARRRN